jgi:serine/threonine protein phosphatase PrpC
MQIIDSLDKNLRSNALVSLALEHGSEDNITAMTIDLS